MARISTLMTIWMFGVLLAPFDAQAQSASENRCFPWQEFRDGACVAKAEPAPGQSRQLTTTPREDPPPAAAPVIVPPAPAPLAAATQPAIICDGGVRTGDTCSCPDGFTLLPAVSGSGGSCVRRNAENCRGGSLTAAGICLCDGHVTMSGETYALEFLAGKCVPKRCPESSYLKEGKCVASNDTRFSFTCRTGYIPDDHIASTEAAGLQCAPDPTFCPRDAKRTDGTCAKTSAIGIACFEGYCTCGPNADWVNYLCQCNAPYRNVGGSCVAEPSLSTSEKARPELQSADPAPSHNPCPRGMVRTRSGKCAVAATRLPSIGELGHRYERAYRYRDFPSQQGPAQQPDPMRR